MSSCYLAHGLEKLKPKIKNHGGNALRRLRLDLGCNAIAAAAVSLLKTCSFSEIMGFLILPFCILLVFRLPFRHVQPVCPIHVRSIVRQLYYMAEDLLASQEGLCSMGLVS
jgi:hypothetical protein